jgi:hypothetical protein
MIKEITKKVAHGKRKSQKCKPKSCTEKRTLVCKQIEIPYLLNGFVVNAS